MNLRKVLSTFILIMGVGMSQDAKQVVIACNLNAISKAERPRYSELTKKLRAGVRDRAELPDGYSYNLDGSAILLSQVGEWISLERLCCPFLTLTISVAGGESDWLLTLTGPKGVKPLLMEEFPDQQRTRQEYGARQNSMGTFTIPAPKRSS